MAWCKNVFVSPTNLHCSQTSGTPGAGKSRLFPLQIYTALKRRWQRIKTKIVCFPYKFTLLSNIVLCGYSVWVVCFPYKFTLLSNFHFLSLIPVVVCFPYKFTLLSNRCTHSYSINEFVSPTNLHCSQTTS